MKKRSLSFPSRGSFLAAGLVLSLAASSLAQTSTVPVVTIRATDPYADCLGDTGSFTVFRAGPTNQTLNVFYAIGGTASNGVDYAQISSWVNIPAGVRASSIIISPINHGQTGTNAVFLELEPPPVLPPVNYAIGYPSNATVYIQCQGNSTTNIPPTVRISTPTNGATFLTPVNIGICADARDTDGFVTTVEFFAGTNSLGVRTLCPTCAGPLNPFCLVWSNVPPGDYVLTALATDNRGASTTSDPVNISVREGPPPPPPTNLPPVVRIISPANGSVFRAPVNIPIYSYARDPDGSVTMVEFFAGSTSLGLGSKIVCSNATMTCTNCPTRPCPTNVYLLVWSNAPLGTYPLRAKATDDDGASTLSEPVNVTILPPPPPPTNRPPIVTIVARDPIAIEGTNCWVWPGMTNTTPTWSDWCNRTGTVCRVFTNCGPKNAIFSVHRYGDTNDALMVPYDIGGSATNGVDYVALPGVVTIPAGQRYALITVVPIDDGPPDITSTVILKLTPSTNVPPDYLLGYPRSAGAIILDGKFPFPLTGVLPDRCFHVNANGPDGAWFHIECTTNLRDWTPICTNQVFHGVIEFVDPEAQSGATRFYRAVSESGPAQY